MNELAAKLRSADRLKNVRSSMILELVRKARSLKANGHPVIDLGIGEPDFTTPDHVKQAAMDAIIRNETRYTVVPGTVPMRRAIADKLKRENGLNYDLAEITVGGGAKSIIFNAMLASLNPGDEVIIPAPYWSSYPDIVAMAEGVPVVVDCPQEQRFLISPDQLAAAISSKTRWLILNSPSNPTGGVYGTEHLRGLAEVLRANPHLAILSDDIYEHLVFDGHRFTSILNVAPDLRNRTLLVNGVSKVFAMTGWRLGYAAGPSDIISSMNVVQGQSLTHACSISQAAAIAALSGPTDFLSTRAKSFEKRRDIVVAEINKADGLNCVGPEGAFYAFPDCSGVIGKSTSDGMLISSDIDFCTYLLEEHFVSVVPGETFGLSPHFRISTAASDSNLAGACARIQSACAGLSCT